MSIKLPDDLMANISGGKLPKGWQIIADSMAPSFMEQYPNATYEEALGILGQYITDPEDFAEIAEYMKKFFN